ncbi:MAG: hypothetical protein KBE41_02350 [Lutibacter sp.]|nr:hypothetical protein [Lutibacter sp.]
MFSSSTHIEVFSKIENENFLIKLIEQLNKDFQMANVSESIADTLLISVVNDRLNEILLSLITNHYDDYLNLLYRIDISENELATIKGTDLKENINEVAFLIIKREFQKVWFKSRI